jgi:hypothetical protein
MSLLSPLRPKSGALQWRAGLCLLLAVLFLYNPFLTILGTSEAVHVGHPLSYRATVASSELQRFTVNPVKSLIAALEPLVTAKLVQAAALYAVLPAQPRESFRRASLVVCSCLWFRPPPVL